MPVRVSLLLAVMLTTILSTKAQIRYVREHLQTRANGYVGCRENLFGDTVLRQEIGRGVANIQDCAVRCMGYEVFGMKDGDHCFCDSSLSYVQLIVYTVRENECNRLCRHPYYNLYWICGGANRMSLFLTEKHITYMEQFPEEPLMKLLNARRHLQTIENGYDGCWKDTIAERLLQHEIGRGVQNIQECALRCLGYRYFGMEDKDQCFCGHELQVSSSLERVGDADCYKFCRQPGYNNIDWICGAGFRITVYRTEDHYTYMEQFPDHPLWKLLFARQHLQTIENGYYGCWTDNIGERLLQHEIGRGVQNIQECALWCLGYRYFGMEDKDHCFCGHELQVSSSRERVGDADCYEFCRQPGNNNIDWICGASFRITVYRSEDHYTYMEQFPDHPLWKLYYARQHLQTIENGFYGCWRHNNGDRLLRHEIGRGVQNIQDCAVRCLGYRYFGMADKDQCFCGHELQVSSSRERVGDADCYKFCRQRYNNSVWICGSGSRITVYRTEDHYTYMERFPDDPLWKLLYARQHLQTIENGYYGCWKDDRSNRLLRHEIEREVQTIQDCTLQCTGYTFSGMEDQDQCFCGNELDLSSPRERVNDTDCDRLCSHPGYNNTDWICGAAGRISVYITEHYFIYMEQFTNDSLWKLLYARQHLQTIENGYYGCWKDDRSTRLLRHEIEGEVQNIQDCALQCTGYTFSGMEDQDQCSCGNQLDLSSPRERVDENDCNRLCRHPGYNNTDWICGAAERISVYRTEHYVIYMEQFTNDSLVKTHLDNLQMHDDCSNNIHKCNNNN